MRSFQDSFVNNILWLGNILMRPLWSDSRNNPGVIYWSDFYSHFAEAEIFRACKVSKYSTTSPDFKSGITVVLPRFLRLQRLSRWANGIGLITDGHWNGMVPHREGNLSTRTAQCLLSPSPAKGYPGQGVILSIKCQRVEFYVSLGLEWLARRRQLKIAWNWE